MIVLDRVSKWFPTRLGRKYLFRDVSVVVPKGASVGLIGKNGAGKSTLMRMLGGIEPVSRGRIQIHGSISWPVGLTGGFQPSLSGRDNVRFVARVNGLPDKMLPELEQRIIKFTELGRNFDLPVKTYSSGMRTRLGFGLSMAFDFDYYMMDEVTSVGDKSFRDKSALLFQKVTEESGMILVSHNEAKIRQHCETALVIANQTITYFDDIEAAFLFYYQAEGLTA
ncbi:MAG: ABC transporter ATP-binding protein [Alphaproteobacteria bacterium]